MTQSQELAAASIAEARFRLSRSHTTYTKMRPFRVGDRLMLCRLQPGLEIEEVAGPYEITRVDARTIDVADQVALLGSLTLIPERPTYHRFKATRWATWARPLHGPYDLWLVIEPEL